MLNYSVAELRIKFLYFCMQKYEEKMKPKNFYQEKNVPRSVKTQFQERSYRNILAF